MRFGSDLPAVVMLVPKESRRRRFVRVRQSVGQDREQLVYWQAGRYALHEQRLVSNGEHLNLGGRSLRPFHGLLGQLLNATSGRRRNVDLSLGSDWFQLCQIVYRQRQALQAGYPAACQGPT